MKILVAIKPKSGSKVLSKNTLLWAPRAGYDLRIFINPKELVEYQNAIDDANYQQYLDLRYDMLVTNETPQFYARKRGYDLLLTLPDNLKGWNSSRNKDKMVIEYAKDVGTARLDFSQDKLNSFKRFGNGAIIKRL